MIINVTDLEDSSTQPDTGPVLRWVQSSDSSSQPYSWCTGSQRTGPWRWSTCLQDTAVGCGSLWGSIGHQDRCQGQARWILPYSNSQQYTGHWVQSAHSCHSRSLKNKRSIDMFVPPSSVVGRGRHHHHHHYRILCSLSVCRVTHSSRHKKNTMM
jgi:hypothetical protein